MKFIAQNSPNRAWMTVALLWPVACLNYLDRLLITTLREPLVGEISMTDAQFGMLTTAFLWVYGIASPLGGFLADRFGRTTVILLSLVIWSMLTWATAYMQSYESLLAVRALMGLSEACYIPAALALIADAHSPATRSRAIGIHMSGVYTGAALGGVGAIIAEQLGWRSPFSLFGIFGIVYAVMLLAFLRDVPRSEKNPDAVTPLEKSARGFDFVKLILKNPAVWILALHMSLLTPSYWLCNAWLPTFLRERFSMGIGGAGISATGYVQAASFAGILLGGWWADRWFKTNGNARIFVPLIGFAFAAPAFAGTSGTGVFSVAIFGLIIFGIARGFSDANLMPILCQKISPAYRATAYGFLNLVSCAASGLVVYAGGWWRDGGRELGALFLAAAMLMLVSATLLLLLRNKKGDALAG